MLAREHQLPQSLTAFLTTGRTVTVIPPQEMEGASPKSPLASARCSRASSHSPQACRS